MANIVPILKKRANLISKSIITKVSFPFSPKFMQDVCLINCIITFIKLSSVWMSTRSQLLTQPSSYGKKMKKTLNNSGVAEMLLSDLSKVLPFLRQNLPIVKSSSIQL